MADHAFYFSSEDESNHYFTCFKCGYVIGFNKPGIGEPCADLSGSEPVFPYGGEKHATPCEYQLPGEV